MGKAVFLAVLLCAASAHGAQLKVRNTVLPLDTYAAGVHTISSTIIPSSVSLIELTFSRETWTDPSVILESELEISYDAGKTWAEWCAGKAAGGILENHTETVFTCFDRNTGLSTRRVRGSFTITGGSLTTIVEIVVQ
jgi:hypothetical protein